MELVSLQTLEFSLTRPILENRWESLANSGGQGSLTSTLNNKEGLGTNANDFQH